jgi:hypothetical protein
MPDNRARQLAEAALREIVLQVERLEHARECSDNENCEATDAAVFAGLNFQYDGTQSPTAEEREEYHNEESAREDIEQSDYGVEVRSDWVSPGEAFEASEYTILLAGGGPALRIIGDLDNGTPCTARLEYQDWFTPWEEYFGEEVQDREALLNFASQFYFG